MFGGIFNTFGKKKGDKVKKLLDQSEELEHYPSDPDAKVSGENGLLYCYFFVNA